MRRLGCAGWCRPRPSASSSELSPPFLLSMSPSTPPESPPTARTQFVVGRIRLRPSLFGLGTLNVPLNPLHVESTFGSPGWPIRYNLLSCWPPLANLTRPSTLPSRRRLLLPSFRPESVALLAVGYIYGGIW